MNERKWVVAFTIPGREWEVVKSLTKKRIENYLPTIENEAKTGSRNREATAPLFKGYIFIKVSECERLMLRSIDGIINLIYWSGHPITVEDREIRLVQCFLQDFKEIQLVRVEMNRVEPIYAKSMNSLFINGSDVLVKESESIVLPFFGFAIVTKASPEKSASIPALQTDALFDWDKKDNRAYNSMQ